MRQLNAASCALLLLFTASPAGARGIEFVFGEGACPAADALQREVVRLTPRARQGELFERVRVNVADAGETYRVTLITSGDRQDKSFDDPNRDCDRRARFAAVFIVVTLFPPELDLESVPSSDSGTARATDGGVGAGDRATPPPERKPRREPTPVRRRAASKEREPDPETELETETNDAPFEPIARLELCFEGGGAPKLADSVGMTRVGPTVLGVLGRGSLLLTLGVGYTFPARFDAGPLRVRMTEVPARVGVRLLSEYGDLSVAFDVGLAGAARSVRGLDAVFPNEASTVAIGVRGDVGVSYHLSERFQVLGGLMTTLEPMPAEISALPQGRAGTMPWLWLGARAGMAFAL